MIYECVCAGLNVVLASHPLNRRLSLLVWKSLLLPTNGLRDLLCQIELPSLLLLYPNFGMSDCLTSIRSFYLLSKLRIDGLIVQHYSLGNCPLLFQSLTKLFLFAFALCVCDLSLLYF